MSKNLKAFLDMLAWSEGTSTSKYTKDRGYDVVVGGVDSPHTFSSYNSHPAVLVTVNSKGLKSTAAGRYQLLQRYYGPYAAQLGLKDFSPASQDAIAVQQIKERRALPDIEAGRIEAAIVKCSNIWASLPGAGYGQKEHNMAVLIDQYQKAGGNLS